LFSYLSVEIIEQITGSERPREQADANL